jgi:hypothetical protein
MANLYTADGGGSIVKKLVTAKNNYNLTSPTGANITADYIAPKAAVPVAPKPVAIVQPNGSTITNDISATKTNTVIPKPKVTVAPTRPQAYDLDSIYHTPAPPVIHNTYAPTVQTDAGIKAAAPKTLGTGNPTSGSNVADYTRSTAPSTAPFQAPTYESDAGIKPASSVTLSPQQRVLIQEANTSLAKLYRDLEAAKNTPRLFSNGQPTSIEVQIMGKIQELENYKTKVIGAPTYADMGNYAPTVESDAGIRASSSFPDIVRPEAPLNPTAPITPAITPVANNQGMVTTVGSNPPASQTKTGTVPAAKDTKTSAATLYDFANSNGMDLKWIDGKVVLDGQELPRDAMEAAGGKLINGRWTFPDESAIMNLLGGNATPESVAGIGAMTPDAIDAILAQYQGNLSDIADQIKGLSIDDYINKAWESLRPMFDYQSNELRGEAQMRGLANEVGQERRGLGTSGLYQADNMTTDKALYNALNQLFAQTNEQALAQGQSMYNMERTRLTDLYTIAGADFNSAMDVLNTKLDVYYKNENLALDKGRLDLDQDRFGLENERFEYDKVTDERDFAENKRLNDHKIAMDNWSVEFQKSNAALQQSALDLANKKAPWGVDDYDDEMFITRMALFELLYSPDISTNDIAQSWSQAINEYPELSQDENLQRLIGNALRTRPSGGTIELR